MNTADVSEVLGIIAAGISLFRKAGGNVSKLTAVIDAAEAEGRPVSAEDLASLREDAQAAVDRL
jgi:hypothetical protein